MLDPLIVALFALAAEPEIRTSLETKTPEEAWLESGLRVGIGWAYEEMFGAGVAPDNASHSAVLRIGARLGERWSLFTTLRYASLDAEEAALRFGATIEPTLHLDDGLTLALGVGIGGFAYGATGAPTPDHPGIVATLTLPPGGPLLGACSGTGALALVRVEYPVAFSSLFAMGPALQLDAQWTACVESLGRFDPDTGESIELRQFWRHHGVSFSWMFWWR